MEYFEKGPRYRQLGIFDSTSKDAVEERKKMPQNGLGELHEIFSLSEEYTLRDFLPILTEVADQFTVKQLKGMPGHTIFAEGIEPGGSDSHIRWIAKKGEVEDWAIYTGNFSASLDRIRADGLKLKDENIIRRLVPCTNKFYELYRL